MVKKSDKKQKKFSLYALFGKIGDILFIPILVISLFSSVSMLIQRKQNKPTSFFNISLVNILSKSMTQAGFLKGDTVITVKASPQNVELGDIIAFYRYTDELDKSTEKTNIVKYDYTSGYELNTSPENIIGDANKKDEIINALVKTQRENQKTVADAQKAKAQIYFHMVIGIAHDEYGNIFYRTKGTDNNYYDKCNGLGYVRGDFVVGKYADTPRFIRDAMSFCASTKGMIILVCLPLSILVLLQCLSLIKQIEVMNLEKQLLNGKKRFYDEEIKENLNGKDLETYTKAILYTIVPSGEREYVMNYMWEYVIDGVNASKKEKELYNLALNANEKLDKSNKAYFQTWINGTKGFTKKKIKKYYENNTLTLILSNNNAELQVNEIDVNKKAIVTTQTKPESKPKQTKVANTESIARAIEKANKEQLAKATKTNDNSSKTAPSASLSQQAKSSATTKIQTSKPAETKETGIVNVQNGKIVAVKSQEAKTSQKVTSVKETKPINADGVKQTTVKKVPVSKPTNKTTSTKLKTEIKVAKPVEVKTPAVKKQTTTLTKPEKEKSKTVAKPVTKTPAVKKIPKA